jgi:hypothetical protein
MSNPDGPLLPESWRSDHNRSTALKDSCKRSLYADKVTGPKIKGRGFDHRTFTEDPRDPGKLAWAANIRQTLRQFAIDSEPNLSLDEADKRYEGKLHDYKDDDLAVFGSELQGNGYNEDRDDFLSRGKTGLTYTAIYDGHGKDDAKTSHFAKTHFLKGLDDHLQNRTAANPSLLADPTSLMSEISKL